MSKTETAINRIQQAYEISDNHGNTLIVAYSGGKDSDVLLDLAVKSGVKFRAEHNHTTIDAPQTVYHIREVFARLEAQGIPTKINYPKISMWELIAEKCIPPTRLIRYCCEYLKERHFDFQHIMTGVRWNESNKRKQRGLHEKLTPKAKNKVVYFDENDDRHKFLEICQLKNRIVTNPIIDWTDTDVWGYIRENKIKMNPLYEKGYKRVGCVGCPVAGTRVLKEFRDFPKYKALYIRAFDKMLETRRARGLITNEQWKDGESVFNWWVNPKYDVNQLTLEV
jgi:phosphoadenosine phosphosulfate reductase